MSLFHVHIKYLCFTNIHRTQKGESHTSISFCIQLVSCIDMNGNVIFPYTYVALFYKYTQNMTDVYEIPTAIEVCLKEVCESHTLYTYIARTYFKRYFNNYCKRSLSEIGLFKSEAYIALRCFNRYFKNYFQKAVCLK